MPEGIKTQGIDHKKLRPKIESVRQRIKKNQTVIDMFEEYGLSIDEVDLIPMCFAETGVSARTDHGAIYFNINLLEDGNFDDDDHYMVHEMTHFCQQTTGDQPTQGADEGDYLENEDEIEGFQNQTKFIAETKGKEEAEDYANQVLDHHDYEGTKRKKKEDELLADAGIKFRMQEFRKLADKIPGGLADKGTPKNMDPKQLAKGIKVEMEHTNSKSIAREIALDHLTEDSKYYDKLETIEK